MNRDNQGIMSRFRDFQTRHQKALDIAISVIAAIIIWTIVITTVNPPTNATIRDIPVNISGADRLEERGFAIYSVSDSALDMEVTGSRNDVRKLSASDISIDANVSNLPEGLNSVTVTYIVPPGISVDGIQSSTITVVVEKLVSIARPVEVILEGAGPGQEIQIKSVSLTQVDVSGAESLVASVASVKVNGTLEAAALDTPVDNTLAADAVDVSGNKVAGVKLAHDTISVTAVLYQTKTVPLEVVVEGSVWEGAVITETSFPANIVIKGPAALLSQISSVESEPIDIEGIYETRIFDVVPKLEKDVYVSETNEALVARFNISENGQLTFKYRAMDVKINDLASDLKAAVDIGTSEGITATVTGPVTTLRTLAAGDIVPTISAKNVTAEGQQEFVLMPYQTIGSLKVSYQPVSIMIMFRKPN